MVGNSSGISEFLLSVVKDALDNTVSLPPGGGVVAGVSGGPDSACLLHILFRYFNAAAWPCERLVAVHVNHMLRGDEAFRDEERAAELCASLGVRIIRVREDVAARAARTGMSIEAAAREARYGALENERSALAERTGREWRIAVAHNADDQAETVLMNILRGAGVDGLRGMAAEHNRVIRPLLGVSRARIESYLAENGIRAVTDSSNADNAYMRNRVRNELMPLLRKNYNPGVAGALRRLSDNAARDADYLSREAAAAYNDCLCQNSALTPGAAISLGRFRRLHAAIAARVVRLACAAIGADVRRLGQIHISDVIKLAETGGTGAELHLPGGVRVRRTYGELLFFMRGEPAPPRVRREPPGFVIKSLHISDNDILEQIRNIRYNSLEQLFDADALSSKELVLRYRLSGDFFFPINSPGRKKLKEFFIDEKIPGDLRDSICLLAAGREIVWVIGHRAGERYKVTERTVNVLKVRYMPED